MFESSGAWIFRTNTEIQSQPNYIDKSRSVMTFLTNCKVEYYTGSGQKIPES